MAVVHRTMAYRIRANTTGVWILVLLVLGHGLVGLPQIYHMIVYHESPLTVNTKKHCTMLTCIDWTRQCSRGNLNASVYVYPSIPTAASYLGAVASPEYDSIYFLFLQEQIKGIIITFLTASVPATSTRPIRQKRASSFPRSPTYASITAIRHIRFRPLLFMRSRSGRMAAITSCSKFPTRAHPCLTGN